MYVDYLDHFDKYTGLLTNAEIITPRAKEKTITNLGLIEIKPKSIDIHKMIGISTDGASAKTGKHNGIVKRLRDKILCLIGMHCAAFRCSLTA